MSSTSFVSKLRISTRTPNKATFTSTAPGGFRDIIEVIRIDDRIHLARTIFTGISYTIDVNAKTPIGKYVTAIVNCGALGNTWNSSVLSLVEQIKNFAKL